MAEKAQYYYGDTIGNLLRRGSIYRATTGRDLPQNMMQEALYADIAARKRAGEAARQYDETMRLKEEAMDLSRKQAKAAATQNAVSSGIATVALGDKIVDGGKSLYGAGKSALGGLMSSSPASTVASNAVPMAGATQIVGGSIPAQGVAGGLSYGTGAQALGVTPLSGVGGGASTASLAAGSNAAPAAAGISSLGLLGVGAGGVAGGYLGQKYLDQFLPGGGKTGKAVSGAAGGAIAGAAIGSALPGIGTAVGAAVGGIIGGISSIFKGGSVICTEMFRQGYITHEDLRFAGEARFAFTPDKYIGYLIWATPLVRMMRKHRLFNRCIRPIALTFVKAMIAIGDNRPMTLLQKVVFKMAYYTSVATYRINKKYIIVESN